MILLCYLPVDQLFIRNDQSGEHPFLLIVYHFIMPITGPTNYQRRKRAGERERERPTGKQFENDRQTVSQAVTRMRQ